MAIRQAIGSLIAAGKLLYRNGTLIISASASATSAGLIEHNLLRRSGGSRPLLALTQRGAVALAQNVVQ